MGREEACLVDWKGSPVIRERQERVSWKFRERRIFQESGDDQLSQTVFIDQGGKEMEYIAWICQLGNYFSIVSIEKAEVKLNGELEAMKWK